MYLTFKSVSCNLHTLNISEQNTMMPPSYINYIDESLVGVISPDLDRQIIDTSLKLVQSGDLLRIQAVQKEGRWYALNSGQLDLCRQIEREKIGLMVQVDEVPISEVPREVVQMIRSPSGQLSQGQWKNSVINYSNTNYGYSGVLHNEEKNSEQASVTSLHGNSCPGNERHRHSLSSVSQIGLDVNKLRLSAESDGYTSHYLSNGSSSGYRCERCRGHPRLQSGPAGESWSGLEDRSTRPVPSLDSLTGTVVNGHVSGFSSTDEKLSQDFQKVPFNSGYSFTYANSSADHVTLTGFETTSAAVKTGSAAVEIGSAAMANGAAASTVSTKRRETEEVNGCSSNSDSAEDSSEDDDDDDDDDEYTTDDDEEEDDDDTSSDNADELVCLL